MTASAMNLYLVSSHLPPVLSSLPSMALQEVTTAFLRRMQTSRAPLNRVWALQCRRYATGEVAAAAPVEIEELEPSSFQDDTTLAPERAARFDPAARARKRSKELPPSRYRTLHPSRPSIPTDTRSQDTNSARPNTTAAPCTHINHPHPPTLPPATSSPAHSPSRA
jgi:hypothetical protein